MTSQVHHFRRVRVAATTLRSILRTLHLLPLIRRRVFLDWAREANAISIHVRGEWDKKNAAKLKRPEIERSSEKLHLLHPSSSNRGVH